MSPVVGQSDVARLGRLTTLLPMTKGGEQLNIILSKWRSVWKHRNTPEVKTFE
jgi:hypothetical protein